MDVLRAARAVLVAAALAAAQAAPAADAPVATESSLKAAYLYRFLDYVVWPDEALAPDAPLVVGVAGADEVAEELRRVVVERRVAGREVRVARLQGEGDLQGCCHALFVGSAAAPEAAARLLAAASGRPLLTITEENGGGRDAGMIHFVRADDRLRFDISQAAAERGGLRLRAPLLSVARHVTRAPR